MLKKQRYFVFELECYVSLRVIISFCSNIHSQIKLLQLSELSLKIFDTNLFG